MRTTLLLAPALALMLAGMVRDEDTPKPDDEGFIRDWLAYGRVPHPDGQTGAEALAKQQVPSEAKLKPTDGDKVKVGDERIHLEKA